MRLLILDENYPHLNNLMGDVFVHVRAKEYAKHHEVRVFSYFHDPSQITYEGISVDFFSSVEALQNAVDEYNPDKILIHFYQSWMMDKIIQRVKVPVIIWVHLYEVIGWYRRLFNFTLYSPVLLKYIIRNTRQQYYLRKLIAYANKSSRIHFVFVSNWVKRIAEKDTCSKISHFDIIPNPIDVHLFNYRPKHADLRKHVLLLRSFDTRKYANDIAVKAILILSKQTEIFREFSFTIIGKGVLFDKLVEPLRQFPNVHLVKGAVRQTEIPKLHQEHGIFLCPTRQDSHGVSMCEAMASGLVPIATNNSAIPEYVSHNHSGILTTSPQEIADALADLFNHPLKFQAISANAASSMRTICNIETIVEKELGIIENGSPKEYQHRKQTTAKSW